MTSQQTDGVLTEGAVPSQQLVEGIALSATVILLEQTTGVSLVTMLRVHVTGVVLVQVVQAEVYSKLDTLTPAVLGLVTTQDDTSAQTGNITLVDGLIQYQHTEL